MANDVLLRDTFDAMAAVGGRLNFPAAWIIHECEAFQRTDAAVRR